MLKGVNNIDYRHLFTFSNNRTRSNGWKLELKRFNTSQCGNFFTYKIAPIWNRLPAKAVNSASVEQFKIELDKVIDKLIWFFFLGVSSDGLASLWGTSLIVTHCNYFHLYTRKCQNSKLASHSTVRNPYTKWLSGKNSFIPIKYKYLPSFWDQVEVDTTIFRILGNKWKKKTFSRRARPSGRKSLIRSFFFCDNIYSVFCWTLYKVLYMKMFAIWCRIQ